MNITHEILRYGEWKGFQNRKRKGVIDWETVIQEQLYDSFVSMKYARTNGSTLDVLIEYRTVDLTWRNINGHPLLHQDSHDGGHSWT